ncbi:aromatic ring-hydroxylating oxygenase subunit alpha [Chachezhania sediminis]|uniref:aromatic ring-hydroxylating oxygenase subunit alpha n=1 Tax=Chachezhania sediminis TaxID=2599291 RepID=UPI00131E5BF3|nr:Rieske 2Fe-2S domain-containing protein [Chachezhania sediminis]
MGNMTQFPDRSKVAPDAERLKDYTWPEDPHHVPEWIYTDEYIAELEQQRIFQGRTWNYAGLEVEVPEVGSFIRSYLGSMPIIVVRDEEGVIRAFENRCAHRGAEFCRSYRGKAESFTCPYHQWNYGLDGSLQSVPFRRGVKGKGGMPKDFDMGANSLRRLNVTTRNGAIFVSAHDDMEPFEDYLGPQMLEQFDTAMDGRPLRLLGVHRNILEGNWKLYQENLKDTYHATLLHTYLTTFGLFVASNETFVITDEAGRHSATCNRRPEGRPENDETTAEIGSFHSAMQLEDPSVLNIVKESDSPWTSNALTIWPNMILIRQTNIFSARQIVPMGPDKFMLIWASYGYADDDEAMQEHRLKQNNIFGPGGFIGIDDNEVIKFVSDGALRGSERDGVIPLGKDDEPDDTVITDRALRGMYAWYRKEMGL